MSAPAERSALGGESVEFTFAGEDGRFAVAGPREAFARASPLFASMLRSPGAGEKCEVAVRWGAAAAAAVRAAAGLGAAAGGDAFFVARAALEADYLGVPFPPEVLWALVPPAGLRAEPGGDFQAGLKLLVEAIWRHLRLAPPGLGADRLAAAAARAVAQCRGGDYEDLADPADRKFAKEAAASFAAAAAIEEAAGDESQAFHDALAAAPRFPVVAVPPLAGDRWKVVDTLTLAEGFGPPGARVVVLPGARAVAFAGPDVWEIDLAGAGAPGALYSRPRHFAEELAPGGRTFERPRPVKAVVASRGASSIYLIVDKRGVTARKFGAPLAGDEGEFYPQLDKQRVVCAAPRGGFFWAGKQGLRFCRPLSYGLLTKGERIRTPGEREEYSPCRWLPGDVVDLVAVAGEWDEVLVGATVLAGRVEIVRFDERSPHRSASFRTLNEVCSPFAPCGECVYFAEGGEIFGRSLRTGEQVAHVQGLGFRPAGLAALGAGGSAAAWIAYWQAGGEVFFAAAK